MAALVASALEAVVALPNLGSVSTFCRESQRVTRLLALNPGSYTLHGTNTFLVGSGPAKILVDTGEGKRGYVPLLRQAMSAVGCETIAAVVLTHRHGDHVGGAAEIASPAAGFGSPPVWKHGGPSGGGLLGGLLGGGGAATAQAFGDGHVFAVDGATLVAHHHPGHTEDSVSLYLEEERALFTGDTILGVGSGTFENLSEYMKSLKRIRDLDAALGGGFLALYTGYVPAERPRRRRSAALTNPSPPRHGPTVKGAGVPRTKIAETLAHRQTRIDQVMDALAAGDGSITDLTARVYAGRDLSMALMIGARSNTSAALEYLEAGGQAARRGGVLGLGETWTAV